MKSVLDYITEARSINASKTELLDLLKQYNNNRMFIEAPDGDTEKYGSDTIEVTADYICTLIRKTRFTSKFVKIAKEPFNYKNPKYELNINIQ